MFYINIEENFLKTILTLDMGGCLGVINVVMLTVFIFYFLVGFFGYLHYGDRVLISITLNLPDTEYVYLRKKI